MVDKQTAATYRAEERAARWAMAPESPRVFGSTWAIERLARFEEITTVRAYVDKVAALLASAHPAVGPVQIRVRRGAAMAHYEPDPPVIAIPAAGGTDSWAMNELVVLHELAHHYSTLEHGAQFRMTVVELVASTNHEVLSHLLRLAYLDEGLEVA